MQNNRSQILAGNNNVAAQFERADFLPAPWPDARYAYFTRGLVGELAILSAVNDDYVRCQFRCTKAVRLPVVRSLLFQFSLARSLLGTRSLCVVRSWVCCVLLCFMKDDFFG